MKVLKKLNPKATFKKAGEKLIVANIRNEVPEDIHLIVAHKGAKQLYLFNSRNQMIASFRQRLVVQVLHRQQELIR